MELAEDVLELSVFGFAFRRRGGQLVDLVGQGFDFLAPACALGRRQHSGAVSYKDRGVLSRIISNSLQGRPTPAGFGERLIDAVRSVLKEGPVVCRIWRRIFAPIGAKGKSTELQLVEADFVVAKSRGISSEIDLPGGSRAAPCFDMSDQRYRFRSILKVRPSELRLFATCTTVGMLDAEFNRILVGIAQNYGLLAFRARRLKPTYFYCTL